MLNEQHFKLFLGVICNRFSLKSSLAPPRLKWGIGTLHTQTRVKPNPRSGLTPLSGLRPPFDQALPSSGCVDGLDEKPFPLQRFSSAARGAGRQTAAHINTHFTSTGVSIQTHPVRHSYGYKTFYQRQLVYFRKLRVHLLATDRDGIFC